jgi:hypothetical protein
MAVMLALCAGRLLPPGTFLVLISVRGWVDPRDIVRLEGLGKLKNPVTSPACSIVPQPPTLALNEPLSCIKSWKFLEWLTNCWPPRKNLTPWSCHILDRPSWENRSGKHNFARVRKLEMTDRNIVQSILNAGPIIQQRTLTGRLLLVLYLGPPFIAISVRDKRCQRGERPPRLGRVSSSLVCRTCEWKTARNPNPWQLHIPVRENRTLPFKTHFTTPFILFRYIFLPFLLLLLLLRHTWIFISTFPSYPSLLHHHLHLLVFFHCLLIILGSRDSSVGIVTGYGLDDRGLGV